MDRLTAMQVFVKIVEQGSMSAASESLDISRAMISRYLESLEDWLGVRLLHRTTRKLTLTHAGELALKQCREMMALAEDMVAQVSQQEEVQGRLRLTSAPSFAQAQLIKAVVDFQLIYPKIEIELVMLDRAVDLVEERIDLAIRLSNHLAEGLVARRLAECSSILCAAPEYLQRAGVPVAPEDLLAHNCVSHNNGFTSTIHFLKGNEQTVIQTHGTLRANETTIIKNAVLAGAGIAMLPTFSVIDELENGQLQPVLSEYELERLSIYAVYLSRRHQPLSLRLLIDYLAKRFEEDISIANNRLV